jgi:GDP-mannose 6-dehydrogenase
METKTFQPANIAVFGLGYVGCVTAACFAKIGHTVVGVDRDHHKVQDVNSGRAPFYEPGLQDIVQEAVASGLLSATPSTADALANADVALVCVGTPSERNGNLGLDQLRRVTEEIAEHLSGRTKPLIIAIRSTVFPGTCEEVVIPRLAAASGVYVVSNPEFLREGAAVKDFLEPSLIVVGGYDRNSVEFVGRLYSPLPGEPCLVSLRTAEMIKYACNAFHAVKIAFANEIGAVATKLEVDPIEVMDTLCRDVRLNISTAYLKPGFAFGGSCLPKDLRALSYRASRLDLEIPMLAHTLPSNEAHLQRAIDRVLDLPGKIGIFGLAFKENTDDLRESPVVNLLEYLIGKGREIKVYDPHIQLDKIYGSNKNFILNAIPHIGRLLVSDLDEIASWADHLVLTQKPNRDTADRLQAMGLPVVDLTGAGLENVSTPAASKALPAN